MFWGALGEMLQTKQALSWVFQAPGARTILELDRPYGTPSPSLILHMRRRMPREGKGPGEAACWVAAISASQPGARSFLP